jgi:hypothetical protein
MQLLLTTASGMLMVSKSFTSANSRLGPCAITPCRREYDRTLPSPHHRHPAPGPRHPHANPAYDPGEWAFETRRRGASHAWQQRSRPPPGSAYGQHFSHSGAHPAYNRTQHDPQRDPWNSPHVRRATGTGRTGSGASGFTLLWLIRLLDLLTYKQV